MNSGPRQKFCDDAFVYLGVLPHVQTGQVKAEHLHRFSEPIESIVGFLPRHLLRHLQEPDFAQRLSELLARHPEPLAPYMSNAA